jgi:hypothetical protein
MTMTERRYTDEEVAAIFRIATEEPQSLPARAAPEGGLTLAELQEIGRDVGIAPDAVRQAATAMGLRGRAATSSFLGFPIGVERSVELGRRVTDEEWEHLVVELREVFGAKGTVRAAGSLREWTNGNLQALLEPSGTGHRLRLRTMKESARISMVTGLAMIAGAGVMAAASTLGGAVGNALPGIAVFTVAGLGLIGSAALRLPAWARLRGRQMEGLVAKLAPPFGPPPTLPRAE